MNDDSIEAAEALGGPEGVRQLVEGLEGAVTETKIEEVAEAVLDAILRLSSDAKSPEALASLGKYTNTFAKVLEAFLEEVTVLEVLFAVLHKMIPMSEDPATSFESSRANIANVLKAMDTHSEGEETLIEYGCQVINAMAKGNDEAAKILIEEGAEERLNAAKKIITNERNQKYVVQARATLKL